MTPTRWVVLTAVVVLMVFAVTFAVNFLPALNKKAPKGPPPQARLTIADNITTFPALPPQEAGQPPPPPAECEVGQSQTHDFWFKNENAQDLPVGVNHKTCQCTSVQIWIAPKDWTEVPPAAERDRRATELEAVATRTELKDIEEGVIVPAGAVGLFRLGWSGDKLGYKALGVKIWMDENGPGPMQEFEIRTVFIGPLRSTKEVMVGDFSQEQLPRTVWIPCWSSTRTEFEVDAKLVNSRWKGVSDLFVVGKPVKLSEEELDRMRKDPRTGTVLAGWKVPVTLLPHAPLTKKELADYLKNPANSELQDYQAPADSAGTKPTPFDLGPFRQRVELQTQGSEPVVVLLTGSVQGDLSQEGIADAVRLGRFSRTEEKSALLTLESEAAVTKLELDRERTADFLNVEFVGSPVLNGGRKKWNLEVKWVPKSQAGGEFPRDEEGYRDSAVYIRPVYAEAKDRAGTCLRVPVVGKADDAP
jgi:hypothetical protein